MKNLFSKANYEDAKKAVIERAAETKKALIETAEGTKKAVSEGAAFIGDRSKNAAEKAIHQIRTSEYKEETTRGALRFPTLSFVEQNIVSVSEDEVLMTPEAFDLNSKNGLLAPPKQVEPACHSCNQSFGIKLFRYNCDHCGFSFCNEHSSNSSALPKFGIMTTARMCDPCYEQIKIEEKQERLDWRQKRVQEFLVGELIPYFDPTQDTNVDKAARVIKGAVKVVKALPVGHAIKLAATAIDAAGLLRDVGLAGLAGLYLKEDLAQAMNALSKVMDGMVVSHKDAAATTTACYYHMSYMRSLRGNDPDLEFKQHSGMPSVQDHELAVMLRYAPLALSFIYEEDAQQIQLLSKTQGWTMLYISLKSSIEKPVFGIFIHQERRECVLAIRGTKSLMDCVTDIRQDLVPFPSESWTRQFATAFERSVDFSFLAHKGMGYASEWIFWETQQTIQALHQNGFKVLLLGHSLGAACAALSTILFESVLGEGQIQAFAFATPCCSSVELCSALERSTISVILRDDIVPRATPKSMRTVLQEVVAKKQVYEAFFKEDMAAAQERARGAWVPRKRGETQMVQASEGKETKESTNEVLGDTDSLHLEEIDLIAQEPAEVDLPEPFVPGRIIHIFKHHGVAKGCWVPRDFPPIRNLGLFENLLEDHRSTNILEMLCEVRDVQRCAQEPEKWIPFTSTDQCMICANDFTWNSTSSSEAQRNRDKFNCRRCGHLICNDCSLNMKAIPCFGLQKPQRVCDRCFHDVSLAW